MLRSNTLRFSSSLIKQFKRCTSSNPNPALGAEKVVEDIQNSNNQSVPNPGQDSSQNSLVENEKNRARSNLVRVAFSSLQGDQKRSFSKNALDEKIQSSKTVEELLQLSQENNLTRSQIVKIVATLTEWTFSGKHNYDLESDQRFVALCKILGKSPISTRQSSSLNGGDLSVVIGVTSEDEAASLVRTITLSQKIKVLSTLSYKKRRSLPLLKALSLSICNSKEKLNIKESADALFALASLNFPDEMLLSKICSDLMETIPLCQKSSVFGSICTSIGFLRYKEVELLESLCNWAIQNNSIARHQDFVSLLLCLASVKHTPSEEVLGLIHSHVAEENVPTANTWLDIVWAFTIFGSATDFELSSVLTPKFIERLSNSTGSPAISWKRKLLNVNGVAKLTKGYKGPLLSSDLDFEVPLTRSKDKQLLLTSVMDTLSNIFPSSHYYRTSIDTGMGFLIDAECLFDSKLNPISIIDKKTGEPISQIKNPKRIALLVHDYHDCTRGSVEPCGSMALNAFLAELSGYKVIPVLYSKYKPQSKLLERAKYIEELLKTAAASPA